MPLLTQALEQATATSTVVHQALCGLSLGEAQLLAGHLEEAHALTEGVLAHARERQERGYQRTPDELRQASNHLAYEYQMCTETAKKLAQPDLDQVTRNAFIESFAVYARIFMAFLFEEGRIEPDDVLARHFFSDPSIWYDNKTANEIKKNRNNSKIMSVWRERSFT